MNALPGLVCLVLLSAGTAGCSAQDEDPVSDRAAHFFAALDSGDGESACADLAPEARSALEEQEGAPCGDVITDQDLPPRTGTADVEVFGSMAQVSYQSSTAYLSRFGDRWLLVGAGCTPGPGDRPDHCAIEVG